MNFGKGILIGFVAFAIFIITLAVLCMREEEGLVSNTYYHDDLHFSEVMEKRENMAGLKQKPSLKAANGKVSVTFCDWSKITKGEIKVVRPSDALLDEIFSLPKSSDTVQVFQLKNWKSGLYHFRMMWMMGDKNFLFEEQFLF